MVINRNWNETYLDENGEPGGTPEQEAMLFSKLARQMRDVVTHYTEDNNGRPERGNHAKALVGLLNAEFRIVNDFPDELKVGILQPGKSYETAIRFSNASGEINKDDAAPDLRGIAITMETDLGRHDFLMTNAEIHHGKNAREAMVAVQAGVRKDIIADLIPDSFPGEDKIAGLTGALPVLLTNLGFGTAKRIAGTLKQQMNLKVESLATESYYSRAPIAIGGSGDSIKGVAVKYRLKPQTAKSPQDSIEAENDLGGELLERLKGGAVVFDFEVQPYRNDEETPIEDSTVSWGDDASFVKLAELIIPQDSVNELDEANKIDFNPFHLSNHFKLLGSMNRCRKVIYEASVQTRKSTT